MANFVCTACHSRTVGRAAWNPLGRFIVVLGAIAVVYAANGTLTRTSWSDGGGPMERAVLAVILGTMFLVPALTIGRNRRCGSCGSKEVIPVHSPRAQRLVAQERER